ncbi:MAG TPA: phenylalanine--tRNA ligase beta subunit-related protein [Thermoanaerobaculia bacterium]|jgi:DNA/RNA-binding domain of Phe-tRNA-synthetase-like protein|nr:phenylalanine--tRNA ligase beta subunit-related protein [Thermoanaerobaculia bacterium]
MPDLLVAGEIFERYPEVVLGVITVHGIDNSRAGDALSGPLCHEEERVRAALAGTQISEHPHIAPWREAYRKFGAKPKDHPSSIENLVRRVLKGQSVPHINPLVDLYNTISLRHLVPVGGEDLDRVQGDVRLTLATDHEPPVYLLGEPEARPPKPGEVIYKDDLGTLCRRWNWKEAERTKLTAATRHAFLVIEGLPPAGRDLVAQAAEELAALIREHCGGEVAVALIDRDRPRAPLAFVL